MDKDPHLEKNEVEPKYWWLKPIALITLLLTIAPYLYMGFHLLTGQLDLKDPPGSHGPWFGVYPETMLSLFVGANLVFVASCAIFLGLHYFFGRRQKLDGCIIVFVVAAVQLACFLASSIPNALLTD
jgi:hypothetical protein